MLAEAGPLSASRLTASRAVGRFELEVSAQALCRGIVAVLSETAGAIRSTRRPYCGKAS